MSTEMAVPRLVLASASPRRRELLAQLGATFECAAADIDESPMAKEDAVRYVERMAREKAHAVVARYPTTRFTVLGADTTVVVDGDLLGKPRDHDDARQMLERLAGRSHEVMTALCLLGAGGARVATAITTVEFTALSEANLKAYLASDEPWDKAGAYGIQGLGGAFVRAIHGSYSNVVGLPLCETWELLRAAGIPCTLDPQS